MIDAQLFTAFIVAATILVLMPGPIVALVVANAVAHGPRTGLATVAGASVGNARLVAGGGGPHGRARVACPGVRMGPVGRSVLPHLARASVLACGA